MDWLMGHRSERRYARLSGVAVATIIAASSFVPTSRAAITPTGALAWGNGSQGQLGNGTTSSSDVPVGVTKLSKVTRVSAGGEHSLALLKSGKAMAWGSNAFGQLGIGTTASKSLPVGVNGLTGVTAISAGGQHSLALLGSGKVMAWGYNGFGQLGDGTTTNRSLPVEVKGLTGVTAISAGHEHSLALLSNGTVMAWGANSNGELGDGTIINKLTPTEVTGLVGVTAISAGGAHSLALLTSGKVMAWGSNFVGQLGDGTTTQRVTPTETSGLTGVTALSAGYEHSLALLSSGTVMAWGSNSGGELGDGTTTGPQECGPIGYGQGCATAPIEVQGLTGVSAVSAGAAYSTGLLQDGTVTAWGANFLGQLGNGTTTNSPVPVEVKSPNAVAAISAGSGHTLARLKLPPYPESVVSDNPSMYWRLGEGPGSSEAEDWSGNNRRARFVQSGEVDLGKPGALTGDPSTAMGVATGSGLAAEAIALADSAGLPSSSAPRTIELWFRTALANPEGELVGYGGHGAEPGFELHLASAGSELTVFDRGTLLAAFALPKPLAATPTSILLSNGKHFNYWTGAWHLIDLTFDGSNVTAYEDGVATGPAVATSGVNTVAGGPLTVGGTGGDYQEFAIYPRALSAARILAHFHAASKPATLGLAVTSVSPDDAAIDLKQRVIVDGSGFKRGDKVIIASTPNLAMGTVVDAATTFISAAKLEAVIPDFTAREAGKVYIGILGIGGGPLFSTNALPFYLWTHPIGALVFTTKEGPDDYCTASALVSNNGGALATAGHCAAGAQELSPSVGHTWAFAPGYAGGACLSRFPNASSTGKSSAFGCGFAPEGIWTADKKESRFSSSCCGAPEDDWAFIHPHTGPEGVSKQGAMEEAVGDGASQSVLSAGFGEPKNEHWLAFGQAGAGLQNCEGEPDINFGLYPECEKILIPGASGGPWLAGGEGGFVGAVSSTAADNAFDDGRGAYFATSVRAEFCAIAGC